ncbi:NERD domain-containing protein [Sciscionella marina]|uniref:NERD domain-containing protein n=1 Tax=Sciscionella marina TaxID=508770 RepID=UPI000364FFBF|nr:NERD domain-containing protein [Sciscionella marina]
MLVKVGPTHVRRAEDSSGALRRIAELFASSLDTPGLLLVGARVPHQLHGHRTIGALAITPHGITAIEVADLLQRQRGTLRCPPSASWTVDGQPALIRTRQANPASELDTNIYALGEALEDYGVDVGRIGGLVIVVPAEEHDLHIAGHGRLRRGMNVVLAQDLGNARDLRRHLHHQGKRKDNWSADGALAVCEALGAAEQAPSREELIAEGFAAQPTGKTPSRATSTLRAPALRTPKPAVLTSPEPPLAEAGEDPPTPPHGIAAIVQEEEPEFEAFPQRRRTISTKRYRGFIPAVIALFIAVLLGLMLVEWLRQVFHP